MSDNFKERLRKKRAELGSGGKGGNVLYIEEGTTRIRILPTLKEDFAGEVTYFFLSKELKGIYSASTFGEPCPALEAYQELKSSKDEDDIDLAKKLYPKKAYLIPVVVYEDEKGKKIDEDKSGKLMKISQGVYQNLIDLYLDSEWGDINDAKDGYDVKIIRTGKGIQDTEYTVAPCKNTPLDKKYAKNKFDLDKSIKALTEPYDTVQAKVNQFLGLSDEPSKKDKKDKKKGKSDFKQSKEKDKKSKKDKDTKTKVSSKLKDKKLKPKGKK